MNKKLIFVVLAVMITLTPMGTVWGQGEQPPKPWTNSSKEFRPDIGLMDPEMEPGVNGYKVFNPGAISILTVQGKINGPNGTLSVLATRTGATDAFIYSCGEIYLCGGGDHDSESTLFEDEIWVDGCIKRYGNYAWSNCDEDHTSGSIAHTDTSMSGGFAWNFTAKSWHHFHTSGYVDWNPTSQDSTI